MTASLLPAAGSLVERQVAPGRYELLEIVALPGDDEHFCGGASNPEDFVLVRNERGIVSPLHRLYLAPEFLREVA